MTAFDLSIIIVSWNTRDLLLRCLASVLNEIGSSPHLNVETWVVDNVSSDGSVQMLREKFPWVRLIENRENVGFARANNQAIRHSTGHYVLLLNPDTEVKPGALAVLFDFMETNPQVGIAGARILNPDQTLQTSCYPAPTLSREFWRLFYMDRLWPYGSYRMTDWPVNKPRAVDILLGACMFIRRAALDQVGLLDENYFIYSEEVDLCYRFQRTGWSLYWVPQSQIIHYGGQSTQQVAGAMFLRLYQGKIIFIRKHHGVLAGQIYKLILLSTALVRLIISPLAWLERPPRRQQHLTLASRYWQLIRALPVL
jgi:N-acetylglucosaminyl-diphospho-decaprenol L-rhamnosyltransferase